MVMNDSLQCLGPVVVCFCFMYLYVCVCSLCLSVYVYDIFFKSLEDEHSLAVLV